MVNANKQLKVSDKVKKALDKIAVHPRETYNDIITRLLDLRKTNKE